ncbi:MAG: leucine-rich repeat domain-containing protein [Muribaculaceae bacterium]|nr:leucine-rich repeat domain-containing protein [Muribaculaceae bacterium]
MNKGLLILALSAFLICFSSHALNVTASEAGQLERLVKDKAVTELVVTGTIDARDIQFIAEELKELKILDLTEVKIVAYSGSSPCFGDILEYGEDVLPDYCFFDKSYETVKLPASLKCIGKGAFAGCVMLTEVVFPVAPDSIGDYAFAACTSLEYISLPRNVGKIGKGCFSRCSSLRMIDLTSLSSACAMGDYMFSNCNSLESVVLSDAMTAIPSGMFAGCSVLSTVLIGENPILESIGENAFASTGLTSFPFGSCSKLKTIGYWAFAGTQLNEVNLPTGVESLGEGAFFGNTELNVIELSQSNIEELSDFVLTGANSINGSIGVGETVSRIGRYAFSGVGMAGISLPAALTYIGDRAFEYNAALAGISINAESVPELGDEVFYGMNQSAVTLKVPQKSLLLYQSAEQWKEFNIVGDMSDIEETLGSGDDIKVYFADRMLIVKASEIIKHIEVCEPGGVLLVSSNPYSKSVSVDTAEMAGRLYVVSVRLESGRAKTLKLIR